MNSSCTTPEIAVIGMSGRFPASENIAQFWDHLINARTGVREVSPRPESRLPLDPNYVAKAATVEQAECFDAGFFGILPKLAGEMDPQHRLFLEAAWSALEDAGYRPDATPGRVGIFAGCHMNTYIFLRLAADAQLRETLADSFPGGNLNAEILNDKDYLATRVAFHLNLRGPAVAIQSACSTSLVAIAQACENLASGACSMALAGGVCITFPQNQGYLHTEDSIISPDGFCRTFDADAKGTIFGDGVGCIVLKRLSDAISDGDPIYAVIKGWGVNNDGADKGGYTAPSISGQSAAILKAHEKAGVSAATINYVEAHGTGTLVGDPIEIAALTEAFRKTTDKNQFCSIGSLKSNFGHLDVAAGVAAVIKVSLALQKRQLPPNLHFKRANPKIDFEHSPFFVQTSLSDWPENRVDGHLLPRRAGVSSFGVGGTNAHLVMEEYVPPQLDDKTQLALTPQSADAIQIDRPDTFSKLICLSAKSEPALLRMRLDLANYLEGSLSDERSSNDVGDVAYTLLAGRKQLPYRFFVSNGERTALIQQLRSAPDQRKYVSSTKLVMAFPGQGSQHVGMARRLYQLDTSFAAQLDRAALALVPHVGIDLRSMILNSASPEEIDQTAFAQPAIFMVSYALAQWMIERGLQPDYVLGHSVGEFAAATVAGIMSLEDGARLIAARGRLMQSLPQGAMLAVNLPADQLQSILPPDIEPAAFNAPQLNVVAGPKQSIEAFEQEIESGRFGEELTCRRLRTSHAFHSAMMDPAVEPFARIIEKCRLNAPTLPLISTVTGQLLADHEATSVDYWAEQIRRPVRFSQAVKGLLTNPGLVFCEVGPNQALSILIRQHPLNISTQTVVAMLPHVKSGECDLEHIVRAVGQLWTHGISLDAHKIFRTRTSRGRVHLPTYSFDRQRHWFEISSHQAMDQFDQKVYIASELDHRDTPQTAGETAESEQVEPSGLSVPIGSKNVAAQLVQQQIEIMQRQLYLLSLRQGK